MNFPCNRGMAGVHEGQGHAGRQVAGSHMAKFPPRPGDSTPVPAAPGIGASRRVVSARPPGVMTQLSCLCVN
jgi:hypothetical protein